MNNFFKDSAHVLIIDKRFNSVLLTKRNDMTKLWVMPGGHLKKKESHQRAAIREVKEEIGVYLKKLDLKLIHDDTKKKIEKRVYIAYISGVNIRRSREVMEARWFSINNLPNPMSLYEKKRIQKAFYGAGVITTKLKINIVGEILNQLINLILRR